VIVRKLSLSAWFCFATAFAFAQYTPATVPNTKLVNNSYVSNPDHLIKESTVTEIDSTLARLEKQTTVQVAIVALSSIGNADDADFAQELFTLWGIGASNNNGLLILLVDNPHIIRFHTGLQLEAVLPDVTCKQIQLNKMLPSFKEGNYDEGMLNGIQEVNRILTDPNHTAEITATTEEELPYYGAFVTFCVIVLLPIFLVVWSIKHKQFIDAKQPWHTDYPEMRFSRNAWLIEFGGIPLLIILLFAFGDSEESAGLAYITLYLYLMATVFHRLVRERKMFNKLKAQRKYYEITEYLRKGIWYWLAMAIVFPLPFLIYFPFHFVRKKFYRNHPRKCLLCEGSMKKVGEKEDDQFLSKEQVVEETIKSVNYDVWKCKECGGTEAWHYLNRFTRYEVCPSCEAIAYSLVKNKTLQAATYSSSGRGESLYQCKACNKSERKTYTIAQLTHSSSSSSSGGGSSYSGGSSSSGGSWGGGHSGGGGASSRW
jgi:uncharacterized protein